MKQRLPLILFALGFFLISLVLTMPASQAYKWGLYPEEIQLYGLKGRVLDGKASQVSINDISVNNVSWSWRPLSLLAGKLSFNWFVNDSELKGKGSAGLSLLGCYELSNATLTFNAHKFAHLFPKGNALSGSINLELDSLIYENEVERVASTAKTELLTLETLAGEFQISPLDITIQGDKKGVIDIRLVDMKDSNGLSLLINMEGKDIKLSGNIHSQNFVAKQASSVLPLIANKKDNNWVVSWKGILPL